MQKYKGAISLFMVVILLTSFIFGGVFIDASRVVVAKSKVRNAMNTALRSSMSYYDKKLVGDYGLYAYDPGVADANFQKYFKSNMHIKDERLKMFDYKIVKADVTESLCITNSDEFKRQVIEYSKYRAPVTTTLILIEKVIDVFKGFKSNTEKISESTDALDDFKEQFEQDANQVKSGLSSAKTTVADNLRGIVNSNIEAAKDDINYINTLRQNINNQFATITGSNGAVKQSRNLMDKMKNDTASYRESASQGLQEINAGASEIRGESTGNDGVGSYPTADYNQEEDDVAKQADKQTGTRGALRTAVDNFESNVSRIKGEIDGLLPRLETTSGSLIQAKGKLRELQGNVDSKYAILQEKSRVFSQAYSKWREYDDAKDAYENNNTKANREMEKIDEAIDSYADNSEFLDAINLYQNPSQSADYDRNNPKTSARNIRNNLKNQYSALRSTFNSIDNYNTYVERRNNARNLMNSLNGSSLESAYLAAQREKNSAETAYNTAVAARDTQQGVVNTLNTEVDNLNTAIQGKLTELKNLAVPEPSELNIVDLAKDKIMDEVNKIDIVTFLTDLYNELSKEMQSYSLAADGGDDVDSKLQNGLIKKIKSLCEYATSMFNTFTNLTNLRNNAYMVDYIMDKCTYLTSQTQRNHYFEKGEVEYIIFGNKSQVVNITACIGTLTLMRFVINFFDYFVNVPGDLIAKAIYGLGRGAAKTYLDMTNLLIRDVENGIGLCPSFDKLKLTYSDHLRLLLFFKFGQMQEGLKDTIFTNMNHTLGGGDLNNLYTRMKAEVEVDVNLIVLPIFVGEFTGVNFRDGNFVIKDSSTLGY